MKIIGENVAHKKNELIRYFLCFEDFIILESEKMTTHLVQVSRKIKKVYIKFKEEAQVVSLSNNINYESNFFSFVYSSLKTPPSIFLKIYIKKRKKLWSQKFLNTNKIIMK